MGTFSSLDGGFNISEVNKKLPVFTHVSSRKDNINKDMMDAISDYRNRNPESIQTNVKANWRSGWHLNRELEFEPFVGWLKSQLNRLFVCHLDRVNTTFTCDQLWAIQYEDGDYTQSHDHFPSDFSCVYYVDVEEGCSPIIFENQLEIIPEAGKLIMFPSLIEHEVPVTTKKRTVVSANFFIET